MRPDNSKWEVIEASRVSTRHGHSVRGIVVHYDAAQSGRAVAKWMASKDRTMQVSAHLEILRDGTVIQMVPFSMAAWHAGTKRGRGDRWMGAEPYTNVNNITIGIELANAGRLIKRKDKFYLPRLAFNNKVVPGARYMGKSEPVLINGAWWEPYKKPQIKSLIKCIKFIRKRHSVPVANIVGHSDVSPRRKIDPGPALPWETLHKKIIHKKHSRYTDTGDIGMSRIDEPAGMCWEVEQ